VLQGGGKVQGGRDCPRNRTAKHVYTCSLNLLPCTHHTHSPPSTSSQARASSGQEPEGSGHKRASDHFGPHGQRPRKARRRGRAGSPVHSVGSGASSSGFHKDGDRSGEEEANFPRVTR
jgi:hypothetical protein